jgi:type IV pilus assembly protein PilX
MPRTQRGAALATTLILLVIITLLALGATRFVTQETRMAAGIADRATAFQSAETGLRYGESLILANPPTPSLPPPESDGKCNQTACVNGICRPPDPDCTPRWRDAGFTGWQNWLAAEDDRLPVQGYLEYLGELPNWVGCDREVPRAPNCMGKRYRVVARAERDHGATVILESVYQRP